jgi:hypothetical protein
MPWAPWQFVQAAMASFPVVESVPWTLVDSNSAWFKGNNEWNFFTMIGALEWHRAQAFTIPSPFGTPM